MILALLTFYYVEFVLLLTKFSNLSSRAILWQARHRDPPAEGTPTNQIAGPSTVLRALNAPNQRKGEYCQEAHMQSIIKLIVKFIRRRNTFIRDVYYRQFYYNKVV